MGEREFAEGDELELTVLLLSIFLSRIFLLLLLPRLPSGLDLDGLLHLSQDEPEVVVWDVEYSQIMQKVLHDFGKQGT